MTYCIINDDCGHWYVIPVTKLPAWDKWIGSQAYDDGVHPKWATPIGGHPSLVRFTEYRIK